MANIDQTEATALLNASLRNTAYTPIAAPYLALDTVAPANNASMGTEVTAGGNAYARQPITFAAPTNVSNVPTAATSNAQTFTNMPAVTVPALEIFSASTGTTRRLWYGNLTASKTTAAGDTLSFAIGAVTAALS